MNQEELIKRLDIANSANFYYTEYLELRAWVKRWRYTCNCAPEIERLKSNKNSLNETLKKGEFKNITAALKFRREHKAINKTR
jgi:hypothetical protein